MLVSMEPDGVGVGVLDAAVDAGGGSVGAILGVGAGTSTGRGTATGEVAPVATGVAVSSCTLAGSPPGAGRVQKWPVTTAAVPATSRPATNAAMVRRRPPRGGRADCEI